MKKIFIVGRHRSGTTWLANILASHKDVYTPVHLEHKGQHESAFFCNVVPYCTEGNEVNINKLIDVFTKSDFYNLLLETGQIKTDKIIKTEYDYFSGVMDCAASNAECGAWVEKSPSHTLILNDLIDNYPEAVFVAIKRNFLDTVTSNIYGFSNPHSLLAWIKVSIWTCIFEKIIEANRKKILLITYEELVEGISLKKVLDYAGLESTEDVSSKWTPSSSYKGTSKPKIKLRAKVLAYSVKAIFKLVPSVLCVHYGKYWVSHNKKLPLWFYKVGGLE
ncbi:sulfotransferase family protein [Pseudoalteromonas sp. ZZD1]|uniref:sulfotransferase family protein n=1 Tax=Pseudoalteromonas sp. ZZD1 TaxID=3139395 RepID=UPI003BAA2511